MRIMKHIFLLTIGILIGGCSNDAALKKQAYELAHKFIITDGHIDVPWRLEKTYEDLSVRTKSGDFDYVRAKEGGLDAPFMSIYVPSSYQETGGAKEKADSLIDLVHRVANDHPDKFEVAFSVADVNRIFADGKIALPMGMENGAPILDDLGNVEYFYDRGIRYITLTHAKDNLICDSSYDTTGTWGGLSPFGRKVVKEMNRVGIMVDISHVTDDVINQVLDMTDVPVIASHSSCRHFTPGWERNMGDAEIRRLKDNGGVIQINYGSSFVTQEAQDKRKANGEKIAAYAKENGLGNDDETLKTYAEKVNAENPMYADITEVVDHIDRVVALAGIDHVGIGSDYDGVGDSLPYGLKDASSYPNLIFHLLKRGYSEEDIEKICYKNVWRVWSAVEVAAN
ncbi:MAG: membrane dipeptidase [Candidatus Marinimicrobia bacterium]|jgi:membrane dipeptidase|nr:membrane dipeptidase [Candidatus Neomarinimicrobiota bacterium]MBT3676812.1 membrane dipeptidase [Candidatus Neomarinimicrobiota bacterium]MBT3762712.1 membrane dipeptidase [Candidatus Neomarinimicrobiota bacterium]MBT4068699.1 membrane dipeptidase [Candidatus Neomarinimicrobiota bacterium]MBT4271357.1 membrane dipeptidase [Candidatus Neomarinimicrobiota bacterium]